MSFWLIFGYTFYTIFSSYERKREWSSIKYIIISKLKEQNYQKYTLLCHVVWKLLLVHLMAQESTQMIWNADAFFVGRWLNSKLENISHSGQIFETVSVCVGWEQFKFFHSIIKLIIIDEQMLWTFQLIKIHSVAEIFNTSDFH